MSHLGGSPKMKTIRKGIRKFSWLLILCLSLVFLISPSNAGASDLANEDVVIQDQSETTVEHETEYLESEKKNDNSELEELKNENLEPENPVIETLESESEDVILENQPEIKNEVLAGPKIEISEPLTVLRSQVMNGEFMPFGGMNLNTVWSTPYVYQQWKDAEIVSMLSKITVNDQSITPWDGDNFAYDRIHDAMGGGTTSLIQKLNRVAVLSQKVKKIPANMPLSVYGQLISENTFEAPYTFKTEYAVDYSSYSPLFKNDFILIDDYRQVTFVIEAEDGGDHGRFTGPIDKITLDSYEDTEVPNNVVGLRMGQSMNDAGLVIPAYEVDWNDGWKVKEIQDEYGNPITKSELLAAKVNENQTYTIVLYQNYKDVVVPAIWYPVDKNTNEIIPGLNVKPTYPDMFPRPEVARVNDEGIYEIDLMGVPKPTSEGTWTGNNFMYTGGLWFTNRFHRIVARGYNTYELDQGAWQPGSTVRRVVYGTYDATGMYDMDQGAYKGLHGMLKAPYQEGEIMHLYIATKTEEVSLSNPEFKSGSVVIDSTMSDSDIRDALFDHVVKVEYIEMLTFNNVELNLSELDKLFLFQYTTEDDGEFLKDGEFYKNFISSSLQDLPPGKYEAVFPIYWDENIPEMSSAPQIFSRNRYKFDDTFHFTFTIQEPLELAIKGEKILSGAGKTCADISAGLFSFIVIPDPDNPAGVTGIPTGNVGVLDGGEIDFGNWSFYKTGIYKYTISEKDPPAEYTKGQDVIMTIDVSINPDTGSLSGFVSYSSGENLQFENIYTEPTPTSSLPPTPSSTPTEPEPDKTTQPIKTDPKQETTVSTQLPTEKISLTSKTSDAPTPRTGEIGSQMIIGLSLLLVAGVLILIRTIRRRVKD